jgi:hypothetical protein
VVIGAYNDRSLRGYRRSGDPWRWIFEWRDQEFEFPLLQRRVSREPDSGWLRPFHPSVLRNRGAPAAGWGRSCATRFARGWPSKVSASATSPPIEQGRRAIRGGDCARLAHPSHPISRRGRSGRASFITAVRSLDRILDEAKLFLAVRDELDGRARSGPSPYRPLRERLAD